MKILINSACKKRLEILGAIFIKVKPTINKICYDVGIGILKCLKQSSNIIHLN